MPQPFMQRLGARFVVVGHDEEDAHALADLWRASVGRPLRPRFSCSRVGSSWCAVEYAPTSSTACSRVRDTRRRSRAAISMILSMCVDVHSGGSRTFITIGQPWALIDPRDPVLQLEGARAATGSRSFPASNPGTTAGRDRGRLPSVASSALVGQADAGGDQVGVVAEPVRLGDQYLRGRRAPAARRRRSRVARRPARAPRAARAAIPPWSVRLLCSREVRPGCSRTRNAAGSDRSARPAARAAARWSRCASAGRSR